MSVAISPMSLDEARRITERLRIVGHSFIEAKQKLADLIAEAQERRAWEVLGFPSWTAYIADVFSDEPLRLSRDERREIVAQLSEAGMSTRAIAPVVGATKSSVDRDIQVSQSGTPAYSTPTVATREGVIVAEGRHVDISTGEIITTPTTVTGLDGKTYARAEQPKPRRRPLTDTARDAGWELRKAVERLQRIAEDDRYASNKNEVAVHLRGHLMFAVETCQGLLDHLPENEGI